MLEEIDGRLAAETKPADVPSVMAQRAGEDCLALVWAE